MNVVEGAVGVLKNMAVEFGKEIEKQEDLIESNTSKVNETNIKLENLNKRLKNTLDKVTLKTVEISEIFFTRFVHAIDLFWISY